MKRITAKSGIKGYECKLQDNYGSFGEFEGYSDNYGLAAKLGFKTSEEAWQANPTIQGSTNPDDFRIAPSTPVEDKQTELPEWCKQPESCGNSLSKKCICPKPESNKLPLYKVLNEQRTQGTWVSNDYSESNIFEPHFEVSSPENKRRVFDTPVVESEDAANAQYTALAVNNLHILAEALEYLMEGVAGLPALSAIEGVLIPHYNKAKQALNNIS